jgi:predicted TIM-barrel fold metal-dependent hydrolase
MTFAKERVVKKTRSAQIREELGYPIIDTDFHTDEFVPAFLEYLEEVGGSQIVDRFQQKLANFGAIRWYKQTPEERFNHRTARPPFWTRVTSNTLDLATVNFPKLLHERLPETGSDFAIVYPNISLFLTAIDDEELRLASVRAANRYHADIFRPYSDRLSPIAIVPLHTPQEGIAELEYAVNELGLKAVQIPGYVKRVIPAFENYPDEVKREATWIDNFGLDSAYDYDPFWAKAVELKVALSTHASGQGWTSRRSPSNYQYNHIGHFASAGQAFVKSLFFGGVTNRFPSLKFAILEGGAAWGASLYADLIWHWQTRNPKLLENNNPATVDREALREYAVRYGGSELKGRYDQVGNGLGLFGQIRGQEAFSDANDLNEFALAGITKEEDIRDRFLNNFYFGTESDDTRVGAAFNRVANPFGDRVKAFLASDAGHWDIPDVTSVVSNSYSLLQRGILNEEDLRYFLSSHALELYTSLNHDFFKGTAVEKEAEAFLASKNY